LSELFEDTILLKIGLIILVIACLALLLGLLYISFKMLRETQQKQKEENITAPKPEYTLHPKLKQKPPKQ
jgi:flagellar basal body-associated protein FliL